MTRVPGSGVYSNAPGQGGNTYMAHFPFFSSHNVPTADVRRALLHPEFIRPPHHPHLYGTGEVTPAVALDPQGRGAVEYPY
jgi:hypothetical protein